MPFFESANRFIVNGDKGPPPDAHQLLLHAMDVVQQAVAAGNTSGACLWGVRSMSEEEQRHLQEELAQSDGRLNTMDKRQAAARNAGGELPNLGPSGEHSGPQGPFRTNPSSPTPIFSYVSITNELQPPMPGPTLPERLSSPKKSKRRFSFKSLFHRFRRDTADC